MFEISDLKAKKLAELHEIARVAGIPKFKTFKKNDLIYQILDIQAASPSAVSTIDTPKKEEPKSTEAPSQLRPKKRTRTTKRSTGKVEDNNGGSNKSFPSTPTPSRPAVEAKQAEPKPKKAEAPAPRKEVEKESKAEVIKKPKPEPKQQPNTSNNNTGNNNTGNNNTGNNNANVSNNNTANTPNNQQSNKRNESTSNPRNSNSNQTHQHKKN